MEIDMTNLNILADRYAQAKVIADKATKDLEKIKEEIYALVNQDPSLDAIVGLHFTVNITKAPRSSVSATLVKELLSPEDVALVTETKVITTLRVKASLADAA
jgi:hypothetical protein